MFDLQPNMSQAALAVSIREYTIDGWNVLAPPKRPDVSALSPPTHTHRALQQNKERNGSVLLYSSIKQKK